MAEDEIKVNWIVVMTKRSVQLLRTVPKPKQENVVWFLLANAIGVGGILLLNALSKGKSIDLEGVLIWRRLHFWGIVASGCSSLYLYIYAYRRDWYEVFRWRKFRPVLLFPFLILTFASSAACVLTLPSEPHAAGDSYLPHLIALTAFFGVFALWDILMRYLPHSEAASDQQIVNECRHKTLYWLIYVDIPTPLTFWLLYYLSKSFAPVLVTVSSIQVSIVDIFMGGGVGAVLVSTVWDWLWDVVIPVQTNE